MIDLETKIPEFKIRIAKDGDEGIILGFIRELAEYENLSDQVEATEEKLHNTLFVKKYAEVLIGEYNGSPVCFVLFFHNYSTFLTKPGIYLEDVYVKPEFRHLGLGKIMISKVAKIAVERDCGRMEWACLDWNEPSLQFYKRLGAKAMEEWVTHRLTGDSLLELALYS